VRPDAQGLALAMLRRSSHLLFHAQADNRDRIASAAPEDWRAICSARPALFQIEREVKAST
jgi:hypothetical protein